MMKYSAQTIRLPARYALLAPEEQAAVAGGSNARLAIQYPPPRPRCSWMS